MSDFYYEHFPNMRTKLFPEFDKVSQLTAVIMLVYALERYINLPSRTIEVNFSNFFLAIEINVKTVTAILVAGMAASGADWLLRSHPKIIKKRTIQHWALPSITALVLGITLNRVAYGTLWWVVFSLGALFLLIVLIAEYITVDVFHPQYYAAIVGLTGLSFSMFMILAVNLRFSNTRLIILAPTLSVASGLISLRSIYLRLNLHDNLTRENARIAIFASLTLSFIISQFVFATHYLFIPPLSFGLIILAPAYAITNLFGNMTDGKISGKNLLEPILVLLIIWGLAFWSNT